MHTKLILFIFSLLFVVLFQVYNIFSLTTFFYLVESIESCNPSAKNKSNEKIGSTIIKYEYKFQSLIEEATSCISLLLVKVNSF